MFQFSDNLSADSNLSGYEYQGETNKRTYVCQHPDCGKTFRFKSEMVRHSTTHDNYRPFVCPIEACGKSFKRADALDNHMRTHTRETPFVCSYEGCGMGFTTKASLRYHLLKHKDDKIFKCSHPGCNKAFITHFQLKQHEKSSSVHNKVISNNRSESSVYESYAEEKTSITTDSSDIFFSFDQPTKKVELDNNVQFPTNYSFEDPSDSFLFEPSTSQLVKENQMLKQRLELSEKLLLSLLQQKLTSDSCNLSLNQLTSPQTSEFFKDTPYPYATSL
jgi:uncharacterized Zn-finger protein